MEMKNNKKSLFGHVNQLVRQKKYHAAMFGYELLENMHPDFPYYKQNKENVLEIMKSLKFNKSLIKKTYHYQSASLYQKKTKSSRYFCISREF